MESKEMIFQERLKKLRNYRKLSQEEMAQLIHCSRYRIIDLERGKVNPSIDDIKMLCKIFHVSSDYLLGLKKPMSDNPTILELSEFLGINERALWNIHCMMDGDQENNVFYKVFSDDFLENIDQYSEIGFDDLRESTERVYPWDIVNYLLCNSELYSIADHLCDAYNRLNDALEQINDYLKAGEKPLIYEEEKFNAYELFLYRASRMFNNIIVSLFSDMEKTYNEKLDELAHSTSATDPENQDNSDENDNQNQKNSRED